MKKCRRHRIKLLKFLFFASLLFVITVVIDRLLIDVYSFSPLPFWQDNRTYETIQLSPLPVRKVNDVNLKNFTLVISACCRNVASHLTGFQKNVHAIGSLFRNYRIYMLESDSTDGTWEFLERWAANDSSHVYAYTEGQQRWHLFFRK